jgi:hydroxypyruvate isomerase
MRPRKTAVICRAGVKVDNKKRGMSFEDALFTIICNCIYDHQLRQKCNNEVLAAVKEWSAAGQLNVGERTTNTQKPSAEQIAASIERCVEYNRSINCKTVSLVEVEGWARQLRLL